MSSHVESTQSMNVASEELHDDTETVIRSKGTKRKEKSNVWAHFTKKKRVDGTLGASCNYCEKILSENSGTSHLRHHVKNSCPNFKWVEGVSSKSPRPVKVFDQMQSRRDFAIAVIKHNYPFSMADHEYLNIWIDGVNLDCKIPSRHTVRRDVLEILEDVKPQFYQFLEGLTSKVSLTTDVWTSSHNHKAYSSFTIHYIDDNWELHKKIAAFKELPYPHDGNALFKFMKDRILEWNIDKKIASVVVDNASANDAMIRKLKEWLLPCSSISIFGELLHVRCTAHILNLVVQDGLNLVRVFLEQIRDSIKYLNTHPSAAQKFEIAKQQLKLDKQKEVALDVSTRWNSTFLMLETALPLREAFDRLEDMDSSYYYKPDSDQWDVAKVVHGCLKHYYKSTKHLSGSNYPTSNVFFPDICHIHLMLIEWVKSENDMIRNMSLPMKKKFEKYWDQCNLVLAVGVIFDPRFKMYIVEFFYRKIYCSESDVSLGLADYHIKRVRDALDDLFVLYGGNVLFSNEARGSSSGPPGGVEDESLHGFDKWYDESQASVVRESELEEYLKETKHPTNDKTFDVLIWWKQNSPRLPILSKIARDILAVPTTTVASEAAFSVGGRILDEYRSRLSPESVEALMVSKDLIPSAKRNFSSDEEFSEEVLAPTYGVSYWLQNYFARNLNWRSL